MAAQVLTSLTGSINYGGLTNWTDVLGSSWSWTALFPTRTLIPVRCPGTFANLTIHLSVAPGAGKSHTFSIQKNGVDTGLAVTVSDAATSGSDLANSVHFDAGDQIRLESNYVFGTAVATVAYSLEFTPDTPGDVVHGHTTAHNSLGGVSTAYAPIFTTSTPGIEDQNTDIVAASGSFTSYEVLTNTSPGLGKSWDFVLRRNGIDQDGTGGTPDTRLTIADAATSGVWTGSCPVLSGDVLTLKITPNGSPTVDWHQYGFGFHATTAGEYTVAFRGNSPNTAVPNYLGMPGGEVFNTQFNATEAVRLAYVGPTSLILANPAVYMQGPGTGKSYDFVLRVNEATPTSGPTVTGTLEDTVQIGSGAVTITDGQSFDLQSIPNGGPGAPGWVTVSFGVVVAIPPTPEPTFQDGNVSWPLTWLEFTDRNDDTKVFAEVDLNDDPDYYFGYKWPWVVQFKPVSRGLSDLRGQVEHMTFGAMLSDLANPTTESRYFRTLLASPAIKYITNRPLVERMIDDEDRRREFTARIIACGYVSDYTPSPGFQFSLTGSDWLAKKFSRKRKAQEGWQSAMTLDEFPNLPPDQLNHAVPIIFGIVADDYLTGIAGGPVIIPIRGGVPNNGLIGGIYFYGLGLGSPETGMDWNPNAGDYSLATDYPAIPADTRSWGVLSGNVPTGLTVVDVAGGSLPNNWRSPEDGQTWSVIVTAIHGGIESDPTNVKSTYLETSAGKRTVRASWTDTGPPADGGFNVYFCNNPFAVDASFSTYNAIFHVASSTCRMMHVAAGVTTVDFTSETDGVQYPVENVYVYVVAAINADGTESPPSGCILGQSHPYARPLHIRWLPYAGATGYRIKRAVYPGANIPPNFTVVFEVGATGATGPQTIEGQTQYEFFDDFTASPPGTITVTTGTPTTRIPKGQIEPIYVGLVDIGDAVPRETFLVAGHAVKAVRSVFVGGVNVTPGQYGTEIFCPGQPGWPIGTDYVVLNGKWFTVVQVAGAVTQGVVDGTTKLTVNVEGIEDIGDSTGDCITDGASQFLHFMKNWIAPDTPWTSGAWLTTPDFPAIAGLPIIDETSFAVARQALRDRIDGVTDYQGGGVIGAGGSFVAATDVIAQFCLSYDIDAGFNRKGQFMVSVEPIAPVTGADVSDVFSIVDRSFSIEDRVRSEFFNVFPYKSTRDYAGWISGGWAQDSYIQDTQSITLYDQERESPPWELEFLRLDTLPGQTTIFDVMNRKKARFRNPRRWVQMTVPFSGLAYEIGDVIPVTHIEGIGADPGWVGNNVRIMRHEIEPTTGQVRLVGVDLSSLFRGAYILGDEAILAATWTAATDFDQQYGYLADEATGLFSNGDPGKVLT